MAEVPPPARQRVRFSSFELDLQSGELRKGGVLVPLPEQSLRVLVELAARPGELVTREQLRGRLWPDGTFVDYEHGLNAVINRLREALGDSADSPRFIQTVPRRGYRFIATVEPSADGEAPKAEAPPTLPATQTKPRRGAIVRAAAIALAGLMFAAAAIWLFRKAPQSEAPPPKLVALTRLAGRESGAAFAPDGDQVTFAWSGEKFDNMDIYVTLIGSTDVRRVTTDPAQDFAPSWSPDGRRIAFLRKAGNSARIHLTSALGGPDSKLSDFPVGVTEAEGIGGAQIAWSPDGRHIVAGRDPRFSEGVTAGLYLIPVDGGNALAITRPPHSAFDLTPTFSADGRRLAYVSCGSRGAARPLLWPDGCALQMTDVTRAGVPTAAPRTLTTEPPVEPSGLAWCRDGQSIVFTAGTPGPLRLWRQWVDTSRRAERIELSGEFAEYPATAVARDRLAFSQVSWDSHLYRFNAAGPVEPVAGSSSFESDPHFSQDGQRLAFVSGRSGNVEIWVAAADGSNPRQLTHSARQWPGSPAWSPDGQLIAFDNGDLGGGHVHIWTVDADGGTPRRITSAPANDSVPRWSRDGNWIYFASDRGARREIWRVPAAGGQPQQITRTGSGFVGYEFGGGTDLVYQQVQGDSALLLLPLTADAKPRPLVDCVRESAFAVAGRTVVYVACDPSSRPPLRAIDPRNGRDRLLGRLEHSPPGAMHVNLAATPDGHTILFRGLIGRNGDVMLIEDFR